MLLLALVLAPASLISEEQRSRSPYLACGADIADRGIRSKRSPTELASQAELKCEPLLEVNVATSLTALADQRSEAMSELETLATKDRIRTRLREDLKRVVVNRVTVERAALPVKR